MALYFIEIRKTYGKHVYLLTHYFGMPSDTQSVSITALFPKGGVGDESEDEGVGSGAGDESEDGAKYESDSVSEAIR
jgi:hypothetical protein